MQGIINHTYFHFLSTQNTSGTLAYGGIWCFTGNKSPPAFAALLFSFTLAFQAGSTCRNQEIQLTVIIKP